LAGRGLRSRDTNGHDGNLRVPIAFAHAYGVPNSYGNIHAYADCYSHVYSYANSYGYPYAYCDAYGNCNGYIHAYTDCYIYAYRNGDSYSNSHSNGYGYSNSHSHSNGNCDRTAAAYTDATASADTAASSLVLLGIRGTRENTLVSSQPEVDRPAAAGE